jgi:hypothetical protein
VLGEIQGSAHSSPVLKVNNKSAIEVTKNPVLSGQSRHIEVKYHSVRESAARGQISVEFIRHRTNWVIYSLRRLGGSGFRSFTARLTSFKSSNQHNKDLGGVLEINIVVFSLLICLVSSGVLAAGSSR